MKDIFKNLKNIITGHTVLFFLTLIFSVCLTTYASAYYQPPMWNSNLSFGWGGPGNYVNYNGYQAFSNPYMYGPALGVYYPYDTIFDVYNGAYSVNAGYNQGFMGYYNAGNYAGTGQRDINAYGYPFPYGYVDQRAWNNQTNMVSGGWGFPPMSASYANMGNPINIYYDPAAFTLDLGINSYILGVNNFWNSVFNRLNEDEEEE